MDNAISRGQAIRRLLKKARPGKAVLVSPVDAVGSVAAHNVTAHCRVPESPRSLRDGYALRTGDIEKCAPLSPVMLAVTQTVRAESLSCAPVEPGQAARVLTGGLIPEGADCVLAEEDVQEGDGTIAVTAPVRSGWFIRSAGGEIDQGSILVRSGEMITPQAAAVMIRTRVNSLHVHPPVSARVFALGSELTDPSAESEGETGRFPADNLVLAGGLLRQSGVADVATAVLPDDETRLVETLSRADLPPVVLTTGGTGRSERDFAHTGAEQAGFSILFDHVDIRPGRNMFAAVRDETILFGLPGPPVAVFACYHAVVLPVIRRLRGLPDLETPVMARFADGISAKPGGHWLVPCTFSRTGCDLTATPLSGKDMPPMLAMARAQGAALIPGGNSILPGGQAEVLSTLFSFGSD